MTGLGSENPWDRHKLRPDLESLASPIALLFGFEGPLPAGLPP